MTIAPKGLTLDQLKGAMKVVYLREVARVVMGEAGVKQFDQLIADGGIDNPALKPSMESANTIVGAALQGGQFPGWNASTGTVAWEKWACFSNYFTQRNAEEQQVILGNLGKGKVDPWNSGDVEMTSPLEPCPDSSFLNCCSNEVLGDSFYAGDRPGGSSKWGAASWLLMGAGAVAIVSGTVLVGTSRGWFGRKHT